MLFSILAGGDIRTAVIQLLLMIPIIMISLSFHEAAHGYIAYKMGDYTAYNLGRITLNPIKHLDPMGALCMLVFGYGWAKPVPINTRNFRDPKKGMAFSAIAGPISNIILGIIGAVLYAISIFVANNFLLKHVTSEFVFYILLFTCTFFQLFGLMNFMLAAFNLIPVPPFDGSRFFSLFLPQKTYFALMKYERYIMIGVLVLMIVCSRLFNFSPFFWVAEKLFDLIASPILRLLALML